MDELRAISIRQPWAHAIVHGRKDIENRGRANAHRGLVLIHASASDSRAEWDCFWALLEDRGVMPGWRADRANVRRQVEYGGIIGAAQLVDSVRDSDSPWFVGPVGLVMADPVALRFVPCRGTVTPLIWRVPEDVAGRIRADRAFPA